MKLKYFILILFILSIKGYGQFDSSKKTVNIAPVTNNSGQISPTSSSTMKYPSIFDKKDKLLQNFSLIKKKPEVEKSIMEKESFDNPSRMYTDKMNQKNSDGEILDKYKGDSFLGEFKVGTKIVKIACRDHEFPDGDVVRIWLNDRIAVESILLEVDFKEVYLDLNEGINKIEVEALNQGTSGPNTAQFVIFDEKGSLITTNKWNLLTGMRAKLIIMKQDKILEKQ